MARSNASWPPEKVAALQRMLEIEGLTARQAGNRLGMSRNAVIGKALRAGIEFARRMPVVKKVDAEGDRAAREKEARALAADQRRERSAARRMAGSAPAEHIAKPRVENMGEPMTLLDVRLRASRCRFPVGEVEGHRGRHIFCASAARSGSSYCAHHHAIVYVPGTSRRVEAKERSRPTLGVAA